MIYPKGHYTEKLHTEEHFCLTNTLLMATQTVIFFVSFLLRALSFSPIPIYFSYAYFPFSSFQPFFPSIIFLIIVPYSNLLFLPNFFLPHFLIPCYFVFSLFFLFFFSFFCFFFFDHQKVRVDVDK